MDESENIVYGYLKSIGYTDENIRFEPDGNTPPDFLLQDKIAIEVRRLNQNHEVNGKTRGIEEDSIPMYASIKDVLNKFSNSFKDKTYFVYIKFHRPLPKTKTVKQITKKVLEEFCNSPSNTKVEYKYTEENIAFVLFPASYPRKEGSFLIGGVNDHDSGGFIVDEMLRNIAICSSEKLYKIKKYRSKYPIWWLALVDNISHG